MQNREDMIKALQRRIDTHTEQGKIQLQRAMDYIHDYCVEYDHEIPEVPDWCPFREDT